MRTLLRATPILLLLTSGPALPMDEGSYRFEQIPTFDEPNPETLGLALTINAVGEVAGLAEDEDFVARGFLYRQGEFHEVAGFDSDTQASPRLINGFGDLAGHAGKGTLFMDIPVVVDMPFVHRQGQVMENLLTEEEIDAGTGGSVLAFNDLGTAVVVIGSTAYVVTANRERHVLNDMLPDHVVTSISALNNRNQLVGSRSPNDGPGVRAFVLDIEDQTLQDLHDPQTSSRSYALDINDAGMVVGYRTLIANNRPVPMRWLDGIAQQLPFPNEGVEGWSAAAFAVNGRGDVLGESVHSASGERLFWVVPAGESNPIELHNLLEPEFFDHFDAFYAFDFNDSREFSGAAVRFDPGSPLGSSNKPGIIVPAALNAGAFPAPGLWAEVARPGTGVEINRVDDQHFLIWYTYDEEGLPTWYFSEDVALERDGWRAEIVAFSRDESGEITSQPVGHVLLTNRSLTSLQFTWRLHGKAGTARFDYLPGACETGAVGHTGTWFDPADPGYGISLQEAAGTLAGVYYFYDLQGTARWVYLDYPDGAGTSEAWIFSDGPCPGCEHATPTLTDAGSAQLALGEESIQLDLDVAGSDALEEIQWQSATTMMRLSSAPDCGAR